MPTADQQSAVEWAVLLGLTLAGAIVARILHRRAAAEGRLPAASGPWPDLVVATIVGAAAYLYFREIHASTHPSWDSNGQDYDSYLECISALRWGPMENWNSYRYFLFPLASVWSSELTGAPLWRATSEVALVSSTLIIVGVYALGRALAARPVAIAGALLVIPVESHLDMLGTPTDYPLGTALYALGFAGVLVAIRDGGRLGHLFAGVALAGYLSTTPKSFPLVFIGFFAVLGTDVITRRVRWPEWALFLAPLALSWWAFSRLSLPLLALEDDMFAYMHPYIDPTAPWPDIGWNPGIGGPLQGNGGYWIPGTSAALTHLLDVVKFLVLVKQKQVSIWIRLNTLLPPLTHELGLRNLWALGLLGLLGTGAVMRSHAGKVRNLFAFIVAFAVAGSHLWGLTRGEYVARYAQQVVMTMPMLLLALFASPGREARGLGAYFAWLPMFGALGWILGPSLGPLGKDYVEREQSYQPDDGSSVKQIERLRARLLPGDEVMQTTDRNLGMILPMLDQSDARMAHATFVEVPAGQLVQFGPTENAHRFVVLKCIGGSDYRGAEMIAVLDAEPRRFRKISRCIYEDLRPREAYSGLMNDPEFRQRRQ